MNTKTALVFTRKDPKERKAKSKMAPLVLGALGVVYGDIGTSPLYAIKESFSASHGLEASTANVYGVLSLVFWALMLVVSIKYLVFVLRADHRGEGGISSLIAMLLPKLNGNGKLSERALIVGLGIFGVGFIYGDGIITPSISVLSAIEGIEIATPALKPLVVPITIAVLLLVFSMQARGTSKIGAIFGPATLLWFLMIAAMGLPWIFQHPEILLAVHPKYALDFFVRNGHIGFLALGSVALCVTGAEALYADMGHFGKKAIRIGWFWIAFPALLINYFGQGAFFLTTGGAVKHTFFGMVGGYLIYPVIVVSTVAAVIASQAMISGAFSLTHHIMQLGYLPRSTIRHTSMSQEGQIYIPGVNRWLMISCVAVVLGFKETSALAGAYGLAVMGTMVITSILFGLVCHRIWNWPLYRTIPVIAIFLFIDVSILSANLPKIHMGGWVPLTIGALTLLFMSTWKRGRDFLAEKITTSSTPLADFMNKIATDKPQRVKGTAVVMTPNLDIAPYVLVHHYRHNRILHERVILLSIITEHDPYVPLSERVRVTDLEMGFVKVVAYFGYMETADVPEILERCGSAGLVLNLREMSYFLGRETFITNGNSGMPFWRKNLFVVMTRNARSASEFFNLPPDQVIEIGAQIQI